MSLRELRRKLAKQVSHTNLPGSAQLSNLVRDSEDNKELSDGMKIVVEGFMRRREIATPIIEGFPSVKKWSNSDVLGEVKMFGTPANLLVMEAVISQLTDFGTPEQIATMFQRYVTNTKDLQAVMTATMLLLRKYIEWGYVIEYEDKPPSNNIDEEDLPVLFNRVMNYLAEHLAQATPTRNEDLVAVDLKQIFA